MLKNLRELKLWDRGSSKKIQARDETPPATKDTIGGLPEIRVQVDEPSNFNISVYDPVTPLSCTTCDPLTACTGQPVMKTNLFRSAEEGCASCSLFWKASSQVPDVDQFDFVSTWSGNGGIFGLCLGKDGIEWEKVVILASNGGKLHLDSQAFRL
jgi:hypothetical protein